MKDINLIYILSAMFFGMLHSLEPGHGKGLVSTFVLSDEKNKTLDVILIGLIATITHTAVIFLLACLGFKVIGFISPEKNGIWIRSLASIIILSIGAWQIWDKVLHTALHHHHHHEHGDDCIHGKVARKVKATSIPMIGILSGAIPCSGGLAIVMAAVATSEFTELLHSFIYIFSFSLGLGLTLIGVGMTIIYGKSLLAHKFYDSRKNIEHISTQISAILIYSLGLILFTYNISPFISKNLNSFHVHEHTHDGDCHHH